MACWIVFRLWKHMHSREQRISSDGGGNTVGRGINIPTCPHIHVCSSSTIYQLITDYYPPQYFTMKLFLPSIVLSSLVCLASTTPEAHDVMDRSLLCPFISFTSAATELPGCCDPLLDVMIWTDVALNVGICCPLGQILDGFDCVPQPPTPPATGVCSGKGVCANSTGVDLGIQFGHCYVLKGLNGYWLGHDSATKYITNGENPAVIFRVCGDTTSCTTSVNDYVSANGTWYMQDQMGDPAGSGWGWIGGAGDLTIQDDGSNALVVGGSTSCWDGICSICITFPPGGAAAPCPLPASQAHLGVAANPNSCQAFYFQEVPCRSQK